MEWHPIETAPKDGQPIIVFGYTETSGDYVKLVMWLDTEWVTGVLSDPVDISWATHWTKFVRP